MSALRSAVGALHAYLVNSNGLLLVRSAQRDGRDDCAGVGIGSGPRMNRVGSEIVSVVCRHLAGFV